MPNCGWSRVNNGTVFLLVTFDREKQTLEMQLPDGPSSDRHAWAAAVGEHGREVYRDDDNNVDIQQCNV